MPKVIGDLSSINTISFSDRRYPFLLGLGTRYISVLIAEGEEQNQKHH